MPPNPSALNGARRPDASVGASGDDSQATAIAPTGRPTRFAGRFGQATTIMVLLTSLASVANYGSNLIFSRLLTPASYGDLTALLAVSVIAAVPTGAAQTIVADRIAIYMAEGRPDRVAYLIRHAVAHIGVVALAL